MEFTDTREYKNISFSTIENDIIFFKYSPNTELDIQLAKELVQNRLDYTKGKAAYTLIDATNLKSSTKEARDYMNSPDGGLKGVLAGAFLSNNVVATLVVNLYLKVSHPTVPAKFFNKTEDAVSWLKKIKSDAAKISADSLLNT